MATGDTVIKALLTLNVANFIDNLNKATKASGDAKTGIEKIGQAGQNISSVGATLTRNVTLPIVTLGTSAVQTASDFEAAMSVVQGLLGATDEDLERLSVSAREWGASTVFSATEVAEGFQYMALAGWDTNQSLEAIGAILYLAGGAMMDLGETSDIVTDNISAFGLSAADAAHFADVLATTMTSSNTDVRQLGEAFKYVAPLAGTLGFTIEDVSLALGLMADNGIKGSQAGTALRGSLVGLISPTSESAKLLNELGIETTNADGSMKSLREILDITRTAFNGMTDAEREQAIAMLETTDTSALAAEAMQGLTQEEIDLTVATELGLQTISEWTEEQRAAAEASLFSAEELAALSDEEIEHALAVAEGTRALDGLTAAEQANAAATIFGRQALSGILAVINTSEEDYQKLANEIDNAAGSSEELYKISQDNLKGSLADLNSSWEELLITIGEKLIPVLIPLIERLIDLIDWIADLDDGVIESAIGWAAFIAAVGPVLSIIGNILIVISQLAPVLTPLIKLVAKAVAGLNPVVLIIGAVVTALVLLWKNCETFREVVINVFTAIKEFFKGFADGFVEFFTVTLPEGISNLIQWFKDLPGNIIDAITSLPGKIAEWGVNVKETFTTWVSETVTSVVKFFSELPGKIWDAIVTFVTETIPEWGANVLDAFLTWVNDTVDAIIFLFSELPFLILIAIRDTVISVAEWGKETLDKFVEITKDIINSVINWFSELPGRIYDAIISTIDTVKNWAKEVTDTAKEVVTNLINNIFTWFSELPGRIWDGIKGAIDTVKNWGKDLLTTAKNEIPKLVSYIVDTIATLPGSLLQIGKDLVRGLWDGIAAMADWLIGKVSNFVDNIVSGFQDLFRIGSPSKLMRDEVGKDVAAGVGVGIEQNANAADPAIETMKDNILSSFGMDALNANVNPSTTSNANLLSDGIAGMVSTLQNAIGSMSGSMQSFSAATQSEANARTDTSQTNDASTVSQGDIYIDTINVRNDDDIKTLSRSLFDRDVNKLRALGRG